MHRHKNIIKQQNFVPTTAYIHPPMGCTHHTPYFIYTPIKLKILSILLKSNSRVGPSPQQRAPYKQVVLRALTNVIVRKVRHFSCEGITTCDYLSSLNQTVVYNIYHNTCHNSRSVTVVYNSLLSSWLIMSKSLECIQ